MYRHLRPYFHTGTVGVGCVNSLHMKHTVQSNLVYPTPIHSQGVYNRLLLVPIVGSACFLCHQLAAVFNASFGVYRMTYKISHINRMGKKATFVTFCIRIRETSRKWLFC